MNKLFWLSLIVVLLPTSIQAEETRYFDVEIILFENLDRAARDAEHWPTSVELEQDDKTVVLGERFSGPLPKGVDPAQFFRLLPARSLQLTRQAEKIENSKSRRVLLHTAWRQPGLSADDAMTVYFKKTIPGVTPETAVTRSTVAEGADTPPASPYVEPEAGEIEGRIKVILSRYLHVSTDIIFQPKFATPTSELVAIDTRAPEIQQEVVYRQHQTRRRIRSRELHYLDNPVLGLLVLITPYDNQNTAGKPAVKN